MTNFEVKSKHVPGRTEENLERPRSEYPVFKPRIELWTSRIQSKSVQCSISVFSHSILIRPKARSFFLVTRFRTHTLQELLRAWEVIALYFRTQNLEWYFLAFVPSAVSCHQVVGRQTGDRNRFHVVPITGSITNPAAGINVSGNI